MLEICGVLPWTQYDESRVGILPTSMTVSMMGEKVQSQVSIWESCMLQRRLNNCNLHRQGILNRHSRTAFTTFTMFSYSEDFKSRDVIRSYQKTFSYIQEKYYFFARLEFYVFNLC